MVTVIFIDLVGSSRARERRDELQQRLLALRDRHNRELRDQLVAPFELVSGDELKGALADPRLVWAAYCTSYETMAGIPFYFSVGFGTIDTTAGYEATKSINFLDGTAFKAARDAMDELKARAKVIRPYRLRFGSAGNPHFTEALNAYVGVLNDLVQHMTAAQRQHFVREFPWNGPGTASPADVSRQAVWETLQRARIDAYREANRGIEALLQLAFEHEALVLPGKVAFGR